MTRARWVMSNRRSPSSSSTLGTLPAARTGPTDHGGLLAATTDHDPHVEADPRRRAAVTTSEPTCRRTRRSTTSAPRRGEPRAPTPRRTGHRCSTTPTERGHRRPGAEQHDQVDPSHPGAPQPFEQALRRRRPVQHQHRPRHRPARASRLPPPRAGPTADRAAPAHGSRAITSTTAATPRAPPGHGGRRRQHADRARQPDPATCPAAELARAARPTRPARHPGDPRDEQARSAGAAAWATVPPATPASDAAGETPQP